MMTDPRYIGPTIPGYVNISNHSDCKTELETIIKGAEFLGINRNDVIAIQFKPIGSNYWIWTSYALEIHAPLIEFKKQSIEMMMEMLNLLNDDYENM